MINNEKKWQQGNLSIRFKYYLTVLSLMAGSLSFETQAALTPYNVNGVDLVYSSLSNLTWTKDANLLGSMIANQGFNTVVNAIINASPVIYDAPNSYDGNDGVYEISTSDFSNVNLGRATWFGAQAFVNYLKSVEYGGSKEWRLPSAGINPQSGWNQISELGQLHYSELGGSSSHAIPDTTIFDNEQNGLYRLSTEIAGYPDYAWVFSAHEGYLSGTWHKGHLLYAWAVSSGQVAAVPLPGAVWFMGTGLIGWMSFKRRVRAG